MALRAVTIFTFYYIFFHFGNFFLYFPVGAFEVRTSGRLLTSAEKMMEPTGFIITPTVMTTVWQNSEKQLEKYEKIYLLSFLYSTKS